MKQSNRKRNPKRQTLISVILRNLALCLFIAVGGILLTDRIGDKIESNFWDRTDISYVLAQEDNLKSEKYDRLIAGGGFQYSGYFEIADSQAKVIYSSDSKKRNVYSTQSLSFIPDSDEGETFFMETIRGKGPEKYLITEYSTSEDGTETAGVILIDEKGYVGYDSLGIGTSRLDEKTMNILRENTDRTYLQKRSFRTNDGKTRYLLYHVGNRTKLYRELQGRVSTAEICASIALVVFCIVFFCMRILKTVREPIEDLQNRMEEFGRCGEVNVDESGSSDGRPVEFQNILSAFGMLERQLVSSERERKKAEEQKQQMLADISHDLKTPATVIQGYAEALAEGEAGSEEEKQQYLNIIWKRSVQLSELINTFFEYNKLNYTGIRPVLEEDDFCEFVREYFANRYEELEAGGSTVTAEIPEEEMRISFDHPLMRRLLENIINNSIRHNDGHADLYAGLSQDDHEIRIRIGDNGKGISPEMRDTVFEPFTVGNKARTSGKGTGLGLSIAKRIVELHGGSIRLLPEGTDGWKVLFEIRLPKKSAKR